MPKCIPGTDADEIIHAMEALLDKRHKLAVGRRQFLKRWGDLRKRLNATPEYAEFRRLVARRSGGWCEKRCGHTASMVHHKEHVAMNPRRALDPKNGVHLCRPCHQKEHPNIRLSA